MQAAVWDRLLSLPVTFFRRYTVGDLANRSLGINAIREMLTGNVLTLLLGAVFSVFSFALLFYYSWRLALIATALVLLLLGVTAGLVYLQIRHQRALLDLQGKIASLLFGLINGIAKLRVAGAEARAYARWAERFAEQRRRTLAAQRAANVQAAFNAVYGVLTSLVIFAVVGFASHGSDADRRVPRLQRRLRPVPRRGALPGLGLLERPRHGAGLRAPVADPRRPCPRSTRPRPSRASSPARSSSATSPSATRRTAR